MLAAAVEQHRDEKGIVFPEPIAPYQVALVALNVENAEVSQAADSLYEELRSAGVEVLYDDRVDSAGVKFNDVDLLGLPVRLVVSRRGLRDDAVEIKLRTESEADMVLRGQAVDRVKELLP